VTTTLDNATGVSAEDGDFAGAVWARAEAKAATENKMENERRECMASLSSGGRNAQLREHADAQGKTPRHLGRARIQEADSDCRRRLRRQMQKTRLRKREPLKRAEINRTQNPFARLRQQRNRVMHHAMREHRDRALVRVLRVTFARAR
jgi:hypothetical protein